MALYSNFFFLSCVAFLFIYLFFIFLLFIYFLFVLCGVVCLRCLGLHWVLALRHFVFSALFRVALCSVIIALRLSVALRCILSVVSVALYS